MSRVRYTGGSSYCANLLQHGAQLDCALEAMQAPRRVDYAALVRDELPSFPCIGGADAELRKALWDNKTLLDRLVHPGTVATGL